MTWLYFTEGETKPTISVSFSDFDESTCVSTPVDLSDVISAILKLRDEQGGVLLKTGTIVTPSLGVVEFEFASTDLEEGYYEAEIRLTYSDGKLEVIVHDDNEPFRLNVRGSV